MPGVRRGSEVNEERRWKAPSRVVELPGGHNDVGLDRVIRTTSGVRTTTAPRADETLTRTLQEIWPPQ